MNKTSVFISLFILVAIVIIFMLITGGITKYTGYSVTNQPLDEKFKECLSKQDLKLFINSDNPSEVLKTVNSEYLSYFNIVNCFRNKENAECINVGDKPVWRVNGKDFVGNLEFSDLSGMSGC